MYEINLWLSKQSAYFTLGNFLFGAVKLTKNADFDKYKYSGYGIGFYLQGSFSLSNGSGFGKNVIIFVADMSLSVHINNKTKDILILGKASTQGLDDIPLTTEEKYFINFSEQQKKFCLSLHYNGTNSLLGNGKDSGKTAAPLCLGNVSNNFSADNMKNTELYVSMTFQSIMIVLILLIFWILKIKI